MRIRGGLGVAVWLALSCTLVASSSPRSSPSHPGGLPVRAYVPEVYVFDTHTGLLLSRIPVGRGPHGLTVWPQPGRPGRYSLGHTGNMR